MALQQLRSSTANKRPTAAAMSDGQLAVNTNATNPGLFFKDADGSIRKVGPVFIGSSAPNSSPATGGSTGHAVGEQWLDNTGGTYVLKIWDGTAWRSESGTFVDVSGDTMTGDLVFNNADIVFEGATADDFETTLTVTDPTADRTITLPNVSGTVVTTGDTGTVTSTMIVDGTIVNADVNASAAIAGTKISPDFGSQNVITTGKIEVGTVIDLNADGSAEFAGNVDVGNYGNSAEGVRISEQGVVNIQRAGTGQQGALAIRDNNGVQQATFYSDGSATFASNVGIGTNAPSQNLHIYQATGGDVGIRIQNNDGFAELEVDTDELNYNADSHVFNNQADNSERMRIDSSGRLLVGTSSVEQIVYGGTGNAGIAQQTLLGSDSNSLGLFIKTTSTVASIGGTLSLGRSRSTAAGIVSDGDTTGSIQFLGADGTDLKQYTALIKSEVDGTPGANDMPGRLVFATTADGASTPTERMRIDNKGSVGIGSTNPIGSAQRLHIQHPVNTDTALPTVKITRANNSGGGAGNPEIALEVSVPSTYNQNGPAYGIKSYVEQNLDSNAYGIYSEVNKANSNTYYAGYFKGGHSDTNGNNIPKVVGIEQATNIGASNTGFSIGLFITQDDYTKNEFQRWSTAYTGSDTMNALRIYRNNTQVGGITTTTSSTSYNTSSDYRLKENVTDVTDGITRLKQLSPKRFNFIAEPDRVVDGFIAHEAQAVVPEAVTGTQDAVDAENNPDYQGIDQSKLVPLLTAALQEAIAKIETLEQRLSDAGIA